VFSNSFGPIAEPEREQQSQRDSGQDRSDGLDKSSDGKAEHRLGRLEWSLQDCTTTASMGSRAAGVASTASSMGTHAPGLVSPMGLNAAGLDSSMGRTPQPTPLVQRPGQTPIVIGDKRFPQLRIVLFSFIIYFYMYIFFRKRF
jgi:hypothetical protein